MSNLDQSSGSVLVTIPNVNDDWLPEERTIREPFTTDTIQLILGRDEAVTAYEQRSGTVLRCRISKQQLNYSERASEVTL